MNQTVKNAAGKLTFSNILDFAGKAAIVSGITAATVGLYRRIGPSRTALTTGGVAAGAFGLNAAVRGTYRAFGPGLTYVILAPFLAGAAYAGLAIHDEMKYGDSEHPYEKRIRIEHSEPITTGDKRGAYIRGWLDKDGNDSQQELVGVRKKDTFPWFDVYREHGVEFFQQSDKPDAAAKYYDSLRKTVPMKVSEGQPFTKSFELKLADGEKVKAHPAEEVENF